MKIAVLSSHTPSLFWFRMEMMTEFMKRGHEVVAIGNEDATLWKDRFDEYGVRYISADIKRNGTNPLGDLKTLSLLKKLLKQEKPDKIFTFQAKTVIYGGLAAHSCGVKEIYTLIAGVGSVFLNDGLKTKVIRTLLKTEYRMSMKHSEKVFFQNGDDVEVFVGNKIVHREKIVMLHGSGVNVEKFTPTPLPEKTAFLCISRLIRDKGVGEYLEAARLVKAKFPQARFLLVGPYDSNPSAISEAELKPYIYDGIIEYFGEQTDVRPYLNECSVFVLPSYREGTPKTVLEAMASGRAVITTDAPGCKETVTDGENGFLVPVKDVKALAEKMVYFIEHPEVIPAMGAMGRKNAEEVFDVRLVNKTICDTMKL